MRYLILVIFLSGCTVDYYSINIATIKCKEHGGVDYLRLFVKDAVCNDGKTVLTNKLGK